MVFEDNFDRVVYSHSMQPVRGHLFMVCLDKSNPHKFFNDFIKVMKI